MSLCRARPAHRIKQTIRAAPGAAGGSPASAYCEPRSNSAVGPARAASAKRAVSYDWTLDRVLCGRPSAAPPCRPFAIQTSDGYRQVEWIRQVQAPALPDFRIERDSAFRTSFSGISTTVVPTRRARIPSDAMPTDYGLSVDRKNRKHEKKRQEFIA